MITPHSRAATHQAAVSLAAGVTQAATKDIVKQVARAMRRHANTIYKMWREPEHDRFARMVEFYLATASVDWRAAELFYQRFKLVRDSETLKHAAELKNRCTRRAAAEVARESVDCVHAEAEERSLSERLHEVREAQLALEEYALLLLNRLAEEPRPNVF
jgi:phage gpG-like protein